jgi:signal transduction histidine kinase
MKKILSFLIFLGLSLVANTQNPVLDSLEREINGLDGKEKVTYINQQYYSLYSTSFKKALEHLSFAKEQAQKNEWKPELALTQRNLGIVYFLQGNYESALSSFQEALSLFESLDDPVGTGFTLKEMGNYFKRQKQPEKALELLNRGIALCTQAKDTTCLAENMDIKGVVLLEMGKLEEAKAILTSELEILEKTNNETGLSYVLNHLAEIALMEGQIENSVNLLQRSTDIREKNNDLQGVAININNTGEVLMGAGRPAEAIPYFEGALKASQEIGFPDLTRHVMQMLSESYTAIGDAEQGLEWMKKSYALKDSLFNVKRSEQLAEMDAKYETAKKEKELALKEAQLQKRNTWLYVTIAGIILLALLFFFILRHQQQKRIKAELQADLAASEASNKLQEERLRISRDLHDNLGAELTLIGSAINRKVFKSASTEEKAELESISKNAREAMGQLRETIWAIRSEAFTLESLSHKINEFGQRAGSIHLHLDVDQPQLKLSPSQTLNLYRIAQEAITNAVKHGEARQVSIHFYKKEKNKLVMAIKDDGKGMQGNTRSGGYGMQNMKARAEELGGEMNILSKSGGVHLEVMVLV